MARTANLHIRIDPDTKAGVESLFATFGITVTDAINMFLHQSLLVGGLPFEVRQPRYNAETEAAIQEARDIMSGKIKTKTYSSVAEMNADLES
jgi:DNA-damage-inducible protein J